MPINKSPLKPLFAFLLILILLPRFVAAAPSQQDTALLTKIQQDTLQYFIRMSDKHTGLTKDSSRSGSPASTAATGFALAAVAIGQAKGWIPKPYAEKQIRKTLKTLLKTAEHKNGFFYHFLDMRTGKRVWGSEASSIDTALLVAGALLAAEYFPGTDIEKMAYQIYHRVDWKWMMNNSSFICMGWMPETGFLPYYWDSYNELMLLLALAIGSPTHPAPPEAWTAWLRPVDHYKNHRVVYSSSGSLFTYQYSHAYIDFRRLDDQGENYFENSRQASLANREYSLEFQSLFQSYSENSWGISASVGPGGYKAYGAKPGGGEHDGTIAPYAALGSIVFTPEESTLAARHFYETYQDQLYGLFGFKGSFNKDKNWFSDEYLGIDQGITVLMLENYLDENAIWGKFMEIKEIQNWIKLCNLGKTSNAAGTTTLSS